MKSHLLVLGLFGFTFSLASPQVKSVRPTVAKVAPIKVNTAPGLTCPQGGIVIIGLPIPDRDTHHG